MPSCGRSSSPACRCGCCGRPRARCSACSSSTRPASTEPDRMLSKLRFRPTLWPTLISVPALIVLIGLCVWQVQRMHWKDALIADREARVAAEPIALPAEGTDPASVDYRRVRLEGSFRHDKE